MSAAEPSVGPDLRLLDGDEVGFQDISLQSTKLRVSPPWPKDQIPTTTASLLSIASTKGLMVVAGPDGLHISNTEKVRRTYIPRPQDDEKERLLEADVTLSVPRVSHVAFNSDESCLIIAAEEGGGLAVYDSSKLGPDAQPAFQIATNGTSVRHLLPNPSASPDLAHLVGIVLTNGQLLLADLKSQGLVKNANGSPVFHENVSAASWSKLGKQIVAGRSDSTAVQIDNQGNVKAEIPRPPQLQDAVQQSNYPNAEAMPITSISWLSTHEFFIVYSPILSSDHDLFNDAPHSLYFVAARASKGEPLVFRSLSGDDVCPAYGLNSRNPAYHFIQRLNDWDTAEDILILASTASTDINLVARFKQGAQATPANEFVICVPMEENRKATLPVASVDGGETSPLGMALDLSTKEVAPRPIPSDDLFEHSGKPLPAVYVLNTDGILIIWWVVYNDAVRHQAFCPGIVHRSGRYAKYRKFTAKLDDAAQDVEGRYAGREGEAEDDETEPLEEETPANTGSNTSAPNIQASTNASPAPASAPPQQASASATASFGSNPFQNPAPSPKPSGQPSFGQPSLNQNGASAFGSSNTLGQKSSPWSTPSGGNASKPSFGQSSFGQPSTPGAGSAFGRPSTMGGGSLFGQPSQPSQPASQSGFGQVGQMGANKPSPFATAASNASPFGQYASKTNQQSGPSPFAAAGQGAASPFAAAGRNAASPFATAGQSNTSPFGKAGQSNPSPFASAGQNNTSSFASAGQSIASPFATYGQNNVSPFASAGQNSASPFGNKPELPKDPSMGSTATLGSATSSFGSIGQPSGLGSSFASKPAFSREPTDHEPKHSSGGLSGLTGGFKLGSGFQGDGSARDDLPKPKTGDNLFGGGFGAALDATNNEKPIKAEPGTESQPSLRDIPAAKEEAAPFPPDPSTMKTPNVPHDAPLPPDPSTYKAPKFPDDLPGMPGFGAAKKEEKDIPIAGSPPVDVSNSQTFSPVEGSDGGPPEDDDDLEEEDGDEEEDEDEDEDEEEDGEWEEEEDEEQEGEEEEKGEEEPYQPIDPEGLKRFQGRLQPPSPKSPEPLPKAKEESRTPPSDQRTEKSSYTPAGMPKSIPKAPLFAPPTSRPQQSPRSPSPQRAVTSPVRGRGIPETSLPSQIKTSAVPPAKPVARPAAPPKPREKTAGELEDEAIARVEALLAAPIEPSKEFPSFYTHTDYVGAVDNTGIGGQIERVFRDINSMIHTVGLNARSLTSFLTGQEVLRKPGERTVDDLDNADEWCLGDLPSLTKLLGTIEKQLEDGKLEDVREKLEDLSEEQREVLKLRAKTTEMKKQIQSHTDPMQQAMREAAPLSAETQAQQTELRQGVQRVQTLLSEVEQKMSMLRADLASLSSKDGQKNGAPVPTVEAVTNTILRMTAMVQQKSADIDLLEAQIKRLPKGIASLRLDDNYEDDLASRLAGNRLLTGNSPAATPPRRPRMAANGDPLGMSGMFGASRFQTPPSGRRSMRVTPDASGLGRSTGSLGASTRKKMHDVSTEEVEMYQARVQQRAKVLAALKGKVERRGAKIVRPE